MLQERKEFTNADYADAELTVTVVSQTGTTVVLTSTTGINEGDSLFQANGADGISVVIDPWIARRISPFRTGMCLLRPGPPWF
jgi:hypothetical protein